MSLLRVRSALALLLAVSLLTGGPTLAQTGQTRTGAISGRALDEAKKPYSDYNVILRDAADGQVADTVPLNEDGLFAFGGVEWSRRFVVELLQVKENKIVCTEGPFRLTEAEPNRVDVNINCGGAPVAWWLLLIGTGATAGIASRPASGG